MEKFGLHWNKCVSFHAMEPGNSFFILRFINFDNFVNFSFEYYDASLHGLSNIL